VDGNNGSASKSPTVSISGAGSATLFSTDLSGDVAVVLPSSSISAAEILDEPGIAQGHVNAAVNVPIGTTMGDIVTVTLTTPASGYIVVEADAQHGIYGSATANQNYAHIQIDETAGGSYEVGHYFLSGYSSIPGAHNFNMWAPVSIRRTYYKPAGTYTFRLEAYGVQTETLQNYLINPTITATFYPTGYGSVTAAVTPGEASQFSNVQRTVSMGQLPQDGPTEGALVDLRELELRDAAAQVQAERAHRQLIEARLAQQQATRTPMPATPKQP
jgi:hypothetical protein